MGNQQLPPHEYGQFRSDLPAKPNHSAELVCSANKDSPNDIAKEEFKGCKTVWDAFSYALKNHGDLEFLGTRNKAIAALPYEWKTFKQVGELVNLFAKGIHSLNLVASITEKN